MQYFLSSVLLRWFGQSLEPADIKLEREAGDRQAAEDDDAEVEEALWDRSLNIEELEEPLSVLMFTCSIL